MLYKKKHLLQSLYTKLQQIFVFIQICDGLLMHNYYFLQTLKYVVKHF